MALEAALTETKDAPAAIWRVAETEYLNFESNREQELSLDLRHRAGSFDHLVGGNEQLVRDAVLGLAQFVYALDRRGDVFSVYVFAFSVISGLPQG